jgi:hypothetical protein
VSQKQHELFNFGLEQKSTLYITDEFIRFTLSESSDSLVSRKCKELGRGVEVHLQICTAERKSELRPGKGGEHSRVQVVVEEQACVAKQGRWGGVGRGQAGALGCLALPAAGPATLAARGTGTGPRRKVWRPGTADPGGGQVGRLAGGLDPPRGRGIGAWPCERKERRPFFFSWNRLLARKGGGWERNEPVPH